MTAAAQTSEPTNPTTGKVRLLAAARWLVALLLVHWLIGCARKLIAGLQLGPTDPDDTFLLRHFGTTDTTIILPRVTRALRRATALEAELLARRPTERGFPTETCRAVGARIADICRDLGIFRASRRNRAAPAHLSSRTARRGGFETRPYNANPAIPARRRSTGPRATGPPQVHLARAAGEVASVARGE